MAIKTGEQILQQAMAAATDVTLSEAASSTREVITSLVAHSTQSAVGDIEIFISDDATSAAAERIREITMAADETQIIDTPIPLAAGKFLIAKADNANMTIDGTKTVYSGGDV